MNRKKKNDGEDAKSESSKKVYECRFCALKFCKSQALGGHMNRHRQERESETLDRARMLVFNNDSVIVQAPHYLGNRAIPQALFHEGDNVGDPTPPFRQVYTPPIPRPFPATMLSPGELLGQPHVQSHQAPQPYIYISSPRLVPVSPQYRAHLNVNDDFIVGHALPAGTTTPNYVSWTSDTYVNYINAPAPSQREPQFSS